MADWNHFKYRLYEAFRDRKLRALLNEYPGVVYGVFGVCAAVLLVVWLAGFFPGRPEGFEPVRRQWFYDMNTGELFTAGMDAEPPIKAPSGNLEDGSPAGVRAYVFTENPGAGREAWYVGWIETTTPAEDAEEAAEPAAAAADEAALSGQEQPTVRGVRWVMRPDAGEWVEADSREGRDLVREVLEGTGGKRPTAVNP